MQLNEGYQLQSGKYRILRVLGQGGFGITYLALNVMLDKKVAIKEFFPKDFCGRDNTSHLTLGTQNNAETVLKLKHRFLKEAKNIDTLDHPGIVKIYDIFEENGTAYYVMDYIDGENLNEIVKRNGPLAEATAVKYINQVGNALDYIHSRNMTHFDVKPANIVVRRSDNQPILIDFGLSKQFDIHGDATSTLMHGISHGYSPIELYNAGSIASFSPQTDVYSLGATLYFLIVGAVPPDASSVLNNPSVLQGHLSEDIENVVCMAMHPISSQRISSVRILLQGLNSEKECDNHLDSDEDTVLLQDLCHTVNGHEAADLGLSVLWATADIGAFKEGEPGEMFVWGDNDGTKTLKIRSSWVSRWFKSGPGLNNIAGNPLYDTAAKMWGGGWRMPTVNEVKELFNNAEWLCFGDQVRIFGPSGRGILLDFKKHWTAESPNGRLVTYNWMISQDELGVNLIGTNKDWADCYCAIRPVIDRKYIK